MQSAGDLRRGAWASAWRGGGVGICFGGATPPPGMGLGGGGGLREREERDSARTFGRAFVGGSGAFHFHISAPESFNDMGLYLAVFCFYLQVL